MKVEGLKVAFRCPPPRSVAAISRRIAMGLSRQRCGEGLVPPISRRRAEPLRQPLWDSPAPGHLRAIRGPRRSPSPSPSLLYTCCLEPRWPRARRQLREVETGVRREEDAKETQRDQGTKGPKGPKGPKGRVRHLSWSLWSLWSFRSLRSLSLRPALLTVLEDAYNNEPPAPPHNIAGTTGRKWQTAVPAMLWGGVPAPPARPRHGPKRYVLRLSERTSIKRRAAGVRGRPLQSTRP